MIALLSHNGKWVLGRSALGCALAVVVSVGPALATPDAFESGDARLLCDYVDLQMRDQAVNAVGGQFSTYMYQRFFFRHAKVTEGDGPAIVASKIRSYWTRNEDRLTCTSVGFDVAEGSLLKYAVTSRFDPFLRDAIRWAVPLNKIDRADGRTVLDYVGDRVSGTRGTAAEAGFQRYYDQLRSAGAKHARELLVD